MKGKSREEQLRMIAEAPMADAFGMIEQLNREENRQKHLRMLSRHKAKKKRRRK